MNKTYELPKIGSLGSRRVVAEFDENGIAKITEQALDSLICELNEYAEREPKTGHWIYTEYHTWCCSECGGNPHKGTGFVPNKDGMKMRWKYCNLCGARMVEPQESEEGGEQW